MPELAVARAQQTVTSNRSAGTVHLQIGGGMMVDGENDDFDDEGWVSDEGVHFHQALKRGLIVCGECLPETSIASAPLGPFAVAGNRKHVSSILPDMQA